MIPPALYHYTSVETLLLMLKNKSIRFSRLDILNDPLEGIHQRLLQLQRHVFSSSWTSESNESIPMWKMYSNLKGVRIKMPIDLFSFGDGLKIKKSKSGYWQVISELEKIYEISIVDMSGLFNEEIKKLYKTTRVYGPSKIEYVASSDEISTNGVLINNKNLSFDLFEVDLKSIGLKKLNTWSFEKEYRYRMVFPDVDLIAGSEQVLNSNQFTFQDEFIDVVFNEKAINSIELLVGPMTTEEEFQTLDHQLSLLDFRYDLNQSKIKIRNRQI